MVRGLVPNKVYAEILSHKLTVTKKYKESPAQHEAKYKWAKAVSPPFT